MEILASEERDKRFVSLNSIAESIEGDELLEDLFEELESGTQRYFEAVLAHEQSNRAHEFRLGEEAARRLTEQRDHARRLAHEALVDKLRILARATTASGRNANWWKKITGLKEDRYKIGRWALQVQLDRTLELANEE